MYGNTVIIIKITQRRSTDNKNEKATHIPRTQAQRIVDNTNHEFKWHKATEAVHKIGLGIGRTASDGCIMTSVVILQQ